jgi:hypothetical protein
MPAAVMHGRPWLEAAGAGLRQEDQEPFVHEVAQRPSTAATTVHKPVRPGRDRASASSRAGRDAPAPGPRHGARRDWAPPPCLIVTAGDQGYRQSSPPTTAAATRTTGRAANVTLQPPDPPGTIMSARHLGEPSAQVQEPALGIVPPSPALPHRVEGKDHRVPGSFVPIQRWRSCIDH